MFSLLSKTGPSARMLARSWTSPCVVVPSVAFSAGPRLPQGERKHLRDYLPDPKNAKAGWRKTLPRLTPDGKGGFTKTVRTEPENPQKGAPAGPGQPGVPFYRFQKHGFMKNFSVRDRKEGLKRLKMQADTLEARRVGLKNARQRYEETAAFKKREWNNYLAELQKLEPQVHAAYMVRYNKQKTSYQNRRLGVESHLPGISDEMLPAWKASQKAKFDAKKAADAARQTEVEKGREAARLYAQRLNAKE